MVNRNIIGYDISDTTYQISFYNEEIQEPETFDSTQENYQIPVVIGKRHTKWAIGVEAKRLKILHEGKLATNLISSTIENKRIVLEDDVYEAEYLLEKFIRMSLENLQDIHSIVFTTPVVHEKISQVFIRAAQTVGIPKESIYIQAYRESFADYMFAQTRELWKPGAALFYCNKDSISAYLLEEIPSDMPYYDYVFATVKEIERGNEQEQQLNISYPLVHGEKARKADVLFGEFVKETFQGRKIASVFLTGEGFENQWYHNTIKILCDGRRTFMGNNLYSKGACYAAYQHQVKSELNYIYIDEEKLTERVCLRVMRQAEYYWFPIINWGDTWFNADNNWEILLEDTEDIELHVESIYKGKTQIEVISLEGIPERESYSIRLRVEVTAVAQNEFRIRFVDVGFGQFHPSSGYEVETTITLGGNYGEHHTVS